MKKDRNYYLNLPYATILEKDGDDFVAYHKEYPGITGCGDSEIEAIEELKEAFACLIDDLLEIGEPIIEPIVESKKIRVNVLLKETTLKAIKKITDNRSAFLDKAADYVIKNKITLGA